MPWRPIAGFTVGIALWWFLFFAIGIGFGLVWPEYREAARLMFQEDDMSGFGTPQLLLNFVLFLLAGTIVGWVVTLIAKGRTPALVLTGLMLVLMMINHYILEWDSFPAWYNLIVPLIISGAIFAGSRLVRSPWGERRE